MNDMTFLLRIYATWLLNYLYGWIDFKCIFKFYLFKKSVYSAWRIRPVRIIIVWKHCRSIAHNLQSCTAVMVAVRWQLYRIANSPRTFAPDNVDKYFPSRDTSTRPSENKFIEWLVIDYLIYVWIANNFLMFKFF